MADFRMGVWLGIARRIWADRILPCAIGHQAKLPTVSEPRNTSIRAARQRHPVGGLNGRKSGHSAFFSAALSCGLASFEEARMIRLVSLEQSTPGSGIIEIRHRAPRRCRAWGPADSLVVWMVP